MQNLQIELAQILQDEENLVIDGQLNKNKIIELALHINPKLISILLKNASFKKHFFTEVDGIYVFDKIKFQRFVNNKSFLPDSYTAFKNKIGLTINNGSIDNFITTNDNVVLAWPHKDCLLEGGQTKDDQQRSEIFWNETLAPDEIDRLLDPKVFTNWQLNTDKTVELKDYEASQNMIIKGNNLIALSSVSKRFKNRAKLIYIDPPYNTESDSFRYNDNFSRSTWLTFMKSRIEIAKELLSNDGFLFVHISFHQYAYLKVLMDEIFQENAICTFNLLVRHPNRILKADKDFHDVVEYLLVYTKDKVANKLAKRMEENDINDYVYKIKEINDGHEIEIGGKNIKYFEPGDYEVIRSEPSKNNLQKISIRGSLKEGNSSGRYYEKYIAPIRNDFPPTTVFRVADMGNDMFDFRYFYTPEIGKSNGGYYQGVPINSKEYKEKPYPNFLDFVKDFNNVGYEGEVEFRNGKKPESLIKLVFELGKVKPGDLVIDFFVGSGTTCAVAHKMQIQYIGIEQMDYIDTITKERLKQVILGEQEGISKEVNWRGGGSFVYCELKKYNELYINKIRDAVNKDELIMIWNDMDGNASLSYQLDKKTFNERLSAFKTAPIEEMKKYLLEVVDKNQLYVNYSEINDSQHQVSELDKMLNKQFYSVKI
jgi:adenine-specific DNA-methyltransferase